MRSVKISKAEIQEDKELIEFSAHFPSDGGLKLALDRSPSYFDSLRLEGDVSDIIVGKDRETGKIVGMGHRTEADYLLNGNKVRLGYLSGLRLQKEYRSGISLARGYQTLKKMHDLGQSKGYVTTIQSENQNAIRILESGRAGLPKYTFITNLTTFIWNPKVFYEKNDLEIETIFDSKILKQFLSQATQKAFLEQKISDYVLNSNSISHYLILKNKNPIACFSLWDQRKHKRWKVLGYSNLWKILRHPYNFYVRFRNLPKLPKEGQDLSYVFLCQLRILDQNINDLHKVFSVIFRMAEKLFPQLYLCYTLSENDPWYSNVNLIPAWKIMSKAYFVHWPNQENGSFSIPENGNSLWEAGLL